jgi:superfamily II DNA or RNA helicase
LKSNSNLLEESIKKVLKHSKDSSINVSCWEDGSYKPTPTIVEAAMELYKGHNVEEISRNDASAINLAKTSKAVADIIKSSRESKNKSICFVTGVPGAGKTLVGLNVSTTHIDKKSDLYSVFLSGNGPLVNILREALKRSRQKD